VKNTPYPQVMALSSLPSLLHPAFIGLVSRGVGAGYPQDVKGRLTVQASATRMMLLVKIPQPAAAGVAHPTRSSKPTERDHQ
jgi:hypothetical protein